MSRHVTEPHTPIAKPVRMVVLASLGGALEFYDFAAYGIFAAYIADAFFPARDQIASLASAFAAFAGGYLIRPLGGVAFSHFGDRFGRRSAFLVSLAGMSLATTGMAVCPSHGTWGVWATATFVMLRLAQGFCLGGELPGAVTYVSEAAAPGRAGLACGVLVEWAARALGLWRYGPLMPTVNVFGAAIGLTPLAQMLLLPALSVRIAVGGRRREGERSWKRL